MISVTVYPLNKAEFAFFFFLNNLNITSRSKLPQHVTWAPTDA